MAGPWLRPFGLALFVFCDGDVGGRRKSVKRPVCLKPLSVSVEASLFVKQCPAQLPDGFFCRAGVFLSSPRGSRPESGCPNPASPAWPLFAKRHSPNCAKSSSRWRTLRPSPGQMFLFCSCLLSPPLALAPHIPLTPADDYMPAALNAGRALLFSLQMRSDICTGLSQRGRRERGDAGPLTERGRRARRHPRPP